MLILEVDKRVKGDLDKIWQILTDSESFADAAPDIIRVEQLTASGKDMKRRVHHKSGRCWEEECKQWEPQSLCTMQIDTDNYPLPVSMIKRSISMQQLQRNVQISLRYEYAPRFGPFGYLVDKYRIRPVLAIFARQLLDNLARKIQLANTDNIITARTIIENKDPAIMTIAPDTLIEEACKILTEKRIGCVIATNPDGSIAGILSERDVVNGIARAGGTPILHKPASEFMTHDVIVSYLDDGINKLMSMMSKRRIRHLPVLDNKQSLIGVISIGDIINFRMAELEQESAAMHQYIEGRKWREMAMQIGRGAATEEFSSGSG